MLKLLVPELYIQCHPIFEIPEPLLQTNKIEFPDHEKTFFNTILHIVALPKYSNKIDFNRNTTESKHSERS